MNILQFKQHFLASELFSAIVDDPKVEPIMIYITGSTLTGCTDSDSDYDLCILLDEKPKEWSNYVRPLKYFAVYTPENRKCQWIYNSISDIQEVSLFPQDNIGWAQFKYIDDTFILYKNPKYLKLINNIVNQRKLISINSIFLFLQSCCKRFHLSSLNEIDERHFSDIANLAYHFVWASGELTEYGGKAVSADFLVKLKRTNYCNLTEHEKQQVFLALQVVQKFFIDYKQTCVVNFKEDS